MNANNHLLLVDDEALNRDMLSRRLERHGFHVGMAADGATALQYIGAHAPDLVLLDIMMPGMTGVDVLQRLRSRYAPDQLPVIMVSALKDSDKVVEALNLGANDYITKPVDFPVALARIQGQLARRAAESDLRESEERYALAARGANDGLWDWDLASGQIYYSERWKAMLGFEVREIGNAASEWFSRVHPADVEKLRVTLRLQQAGGSNGVFECEHRMRHRDGTYRWMRCRGAAVPDGAGRVIRMAGSMSDVTAARGSDPLTGLANRVLFLERVEEEFARCRESSATNFAVMFLDIDRFKLINDSLGHLAGDQLLVAMAGRLVRGLRTGDSRGAPVSRDLAARLGADEFAVLLCDLPDPAAALQVAERILMELREPFALGDRGIFCTVSIGIAPGGPAYQSADEVVRDADTAMYAAKSKGRSRCEVFDESMRARVVERLQLENDLRRAVENHELTVHYQPKVRLVDRRVCGFEALARWHHPQRGWIAPIDFIPAAEEIGLIHELDMWVLRTACAQMKRWHTEFPCDPPLAISVNLSPSQFAQPRLVEQIADVLRETGLEPASLRLEVTESVLMDDHERARDILTRLKALGVGLKLDDFGTGYSSLAYLAQLPFDTMKIDRAFTLQLQGGDCNADIVKSILDMAHALGLHVIAEGVEQDDQIARLMSMGCEFGQGFFFSQPVSAPEAACLVAGAMEMAPIPGLAHAPSCGPLLARYPDSTANSPD